MGFWPSSADGVSFPEDVRHAAPDDEIIWGDVPADAMDTAVAEIVKAFREGMGRNPRRAEIFAGLWFALGPITTKDDEVVLIDEVDFEDGDDQ